MNAAKDSFANGRQRRRVRSRHSSASPERQSKRRQDFSEMDPNPAVSTSRARSSNAGSPVALAAEGGARDRHHSTARQEPATATGKGRKHSMLRVERSASPTKERHEMGDTMCFAAKAGEDVASSLDERYGQPNVSLNWQRERRPVPMARRLQQPAMAPTQRDYGAAGSTDAVNPDRWSSSSSVTVEVARRGAPRPAERRSGVAPSTARQGRPASTSDPAAPDVASSMEISSAVSLSPRSGKRAVNIDIEFNRATAAGSNQGMLLRSISMNVEKIIGRLLAPPRSDSRSQLIRGPPLPPRGAYATPWQVPRGYMPTWRPGQPMWDPNARAWRIPEGQKQRRFTGPGAMRGGPPTAEAHARFRAAPDDVRAYDGTPVDETIGAGPPSDELLMCETMEAVPSILERMEGSLTDEVKAAQTASGVRRPSSGEDLKYETAEGIPGILDRMEDSLADQVEAAQVAAASRKASGGEALGQEIVGGIQDILGRMEQSLADEVAAAEMADRLKKDPSTESISRETVGGAPRLLGRMEDSLAAQVDDVKTLARKGKKSKRRKEEKFKAEDTEVTSTGTKEKRKKKKRAGKSREKDKTEMDETTVKSELRKSGMDAAASSLGAGAKKKRKKSKPAQEEEKTEREETKLSSQRRKSAGEAALSDAGKKQPRKMSKQTEKTAKKDEQGDVEATSPEVSERKKRKRKKAPKEKGTKKEPVAAVDEATRAKGREPEADALQEEAEGGALEEKAKGELEVLPQSRLAEAKAMAPMDVDARTPDDDSPERQAEDAQEILGAMEKALVEEVEEVQLVSPDKESPGGISPSGGTVGALPRAADERQPEKGETAAVDSVHGDLPHEAKPETTPRERPSKRRKKSKQRGESRLGEKAAITDLDVAEANKPVESSIAPWKMPEGEEGGAGKTVATTEIPQPVDEKVDKSHEEPARGRRKMSKKDPSHDVEKSGIAVAASEKETKKVSKGDTMETEKSALRSGKKSASKKAHKKAGGKKKKTKGKGDAEKSTLASVSEKHTASHSGSPDKGHKKKGKKKRKKKDKPDSTVKKTEVETGTIGQIALEHQQKLQTSAGEQKLDEHPAAGDKAVETLSELPVPKRSIMKGSSDSRRKSKQLESVLTVDGAATGGLEHEPAETFEGAAAMPFARRRSSAKEREIGPSVPREVDLDTATAHHASKLKKALKAKQHKEPVAGTAEESTFKWSTSTLPSYIREMFFSTYRWGMSSPPTCEPCRVMKWSTNQMGRRASIIQPTPSLVPSPPLPGRRASVVRICPQSISLKESRPPKSTEPKKKKKKKKHKGKSVLTPASTLSSAPATPAVLSPTSGTSGATSAATSQTSSMAAALPAATSAASQIPAKGAQAGASLEQSVPAGSATAQLKSPPTKAHKSKKGKHKGKKHSKKTSAKGEKHESKKKKKAGKEDEKAGTTALVTGVPTVPGSSPQTVPIIVAEPSLPTQAAAEAPLRRPSRPEAQQMLTVPTGADARLTQMLAEDVCPITPVEGVSVVAGTAAVGTEKPEDKDGKKKKSKKKKKGKKKKHKKGERKGSKKKKKGKKGARKGAEGVAVAHKEGNMALVAVCVLLSAVCVVFFAVLAVYFIFKGPIQPEDTTMLSTLMTPIVTWETTISRSRGPPTISVDTAGPGTTATGITWTTAARTGAPDTEGTSSKEPSIPTLTTPTAMTAGVYMCSTSFCNGEAAYLRSLIDNAKTSACVNFYEHVCGSWARYHRDRQGPNAFISTDSLLQDELVSALLAIVQRSQEPDLKLAYEVYQNCAQRDKVEHTSVEVVREFFKSRQVKRWPLGFDDVLEEGAETIVWRFAAELIVDLGLATLVTVDVGADPDQHPDLDARPDAPWPSILQLDRPEPLFSSRAFSLPAVRSMLIDGFENAVRILDAAETGKSLKAMGNGVADVFQLVSEQKLDDTRSYQPVNVTDLISGLRTFVGRVFSYSDTSKWRVLLPSRKYATTGLRKIFETVHHVHLLNYMGFLAVIRMAAYMPEQAQHEGVLQSLFFHSVTGRSMLGVRDTSLMCLLSTERLLPGCFGKAALQYFRTQGSDLAARHWVAQLVAAFAHNVRYLSWMGDLSALLVRYRLKRRPIARLTAYVGGRCASLKTQFGDSGKPLKVFLDTAMLQQRALLQEISGVSGVSYKYPELSETHPYAVFDVSHRYVRVPTVLFNHSVPTNSTAFALHLSRLATRFYQALVRVLFDDPYELVAPVTEVDDMHSSASDLSRCLSQDATRVYASDGNLFATRDVQRDLLYRSTALVLAHRAFRELLPVRRIWNMDFRYNGLPELSSEQLFFFYFALDHCEEYDEVHRMERAHVLTPEHMVNLPLRSTAAFAEAFKCNANSVSVASGGPQCRILHPGYSGRKRRSGRRFRNKTRQHSGLSSMVDMQLTLG